MDETYTLILEIRAAFGDLRALSDRMNAAQGITAAKRAIIEHLADRGPATVPQIAEAKRVSRQHVQIIADDLAARGLAAFGGNPAHRRSHLVDLTEAGRAAFAAIREREDAHLARVAAALPPGAVTDGIVALRALRRELALVVPDV